VRPQLLAAAMAAAVLTACSSGSEPARLAPTFTVEDVRAGRSEVSLAALTRTPVVLNFFAAWCVPCRKELPLLQRVSAQEKDRVAFVGVDVKDSRTRATDLLAETGVTYAAGYDPQGAVAEGFRVQAMPTTFFIRADGHIADQVFGELSAARLRKGLDKLRRPA
jgi:cytochrome c biogenesis protein CcmG/thiol:disulfide interchange protein DsbE